MTAPLSFETSIAVTSRRSLISQGTLNFREHIGYFLTSSTGSVLPWYRKFATKIPKMFVETRRKDVFPRNYLMAPFAVYYVISGNVFVCAYNKMQNSIVCTQILLLKQSETNTCCPSVTSLF